MFLLKKELFFFFFYGLKLYLWSDGIVCINKSYVEICFTVSFCDSKFLLPNSRFNTYLLNFETRKIIG